MYRLKVFKSLIIGAKKKLPTEVESRIPESWWDPKKDPKTNYQNLKVVLTRPLSALTSLKVASFE